MTQRFFGAEEVWITWIETACTNSVVREQQKNYCEIKKRRRKKRWISEKEEFEKTVPAKKKEKKIRSQSEEIVNGSLNIGFTIFIVKLGPILTPGLRGWKYPILEYGENHIKNSPKKIFGLIISKSF